MMEEKIVDKVICFQTQVKAKNLRNLFVGDCADLIKIVFFPRKISFQKLFHFSPSKF